MPLFRARMASARRKMGKRYIIALFPLNQLLLWLASSSADNAEPSSPLLSQNYIFPYHLKILCRDCACRRTIRRLPVQQQFFALPKHNQIAIAYLDRIYILALALAILLFSARAKINPLSLFLQQFCLVKQSSCAQSYNNSS